MIGLRWSPRERPLEAAACFAFAPFAAALQARVRELEAQRRGALRVSDTDAGSLVLGAAAALPWLPGLAWLGRDPEAPQLLLPTAWRPDLPAEWVESACIARAGGACALIPRAMLPSPLQAAAPELLLVPTAGARVPAGAPVPA